MGITRDFHPLIVGFGGPYLGKWSNLTNIFEMGWNHQPVIPMNPLWVRLKNKNPALQGLAASLTAVASALQHGSGGSATDAMHATSEYLASGIGALTVWDAQGRAEKDEEIPKFPGELDLRKLGWLEKST